MNENDALSLLALAEQAAPELVGLDARRWRERLEVRMAELRPALDWFLRCGRDREALRLSVSLPYFWVAIGRLAEGRALLEQALAASSSACGSSMPRGISTRGCWRSGKATTVMLTSCSAAGLRSAAASAITRRSRSRSPGWRGSRFEVATSTGRAHFAPRRSRCARAARRSSAARMLCMSSASRRKWQAISSRRVS